MSSPPPILVAAVAILATRALVILASYAAYLRWRARRTLKALLCAAGLGRAEGDAAAPDPADDEPEVEDVESVAAGLLPPAEHVHDYERVVGPLRAWRRRSAEEEEEEEEEDDDDDDDDDDERRRSAPASASDLDDPTVEPLVDHRARLSKPPAGYSNSGNTCFAASALQCLYHTRALTAHFADPEAHEASRCFLKKKTDAFVGGGARKTLAKDFCVTCEYQDLVRRSLAAKPRGRVVIGALTSSIGKIARHFVRGRQEDSHEYIRSLLDLMHVGWLKERFGEDAEKVLDPRTQETTLVYHIFGGYTCGRVICSACGHESRTYQSALDFPIEVAAGRGQAVSSVAAAMRRNFVDTETLDGANKYKCGGCRSYVKAERGSKIHVSPNVLVVPVKRYQLGRAGKITKFVEYPKTLDLEPYMSSDAPYERSAPTYDLYGVVVHLDFMGSAHSGHYVAFVKLANGAWCKCDDGAVTKTTEATALKQKAYLLFYERRAPRGAPPTRTPAQQARKETLEAAEAARQKRVRQRREAMRGDANGAKAKDETGTKLLTPEYDVKTSGAQKKSARDDDDDDVASADVSEDSEEDSSEEETFSRSRLRASPWPAKVTVTVKLPTVASASALRVEMTDATVSVSTRRDAKRKQEKSVSAEKHVFLEVLLPFPVDDDDAGVVFDSRARTLAIVAPVRPYSARLARAHAAFLRRARREAREKTTETSRRRKNGAETLGASRRDGDSDSDSDSEWVETDGEAQQGSASEGEADEARGLAEGMGMMGLAASPNTRARRARVA